MIRFTSLLFATALAAAPVPSPLAPSEALKAFEVAPGLRVELVAAEPLVASPCALAFDTKGRLFVAENRGYPIGPKEGEKPAGVIALLEDTDGDGQMDKRTVFADGLTFPNGVLSWKGGIIVTCAPDIIFFKDNDGDGVADERRVLLTGFATTGSTQLRVNAPTIGPDGWITLAAGLSGGTITCPEHPERAPLKMTSDVRFHPETLEVQAVDGRSQYGMSFDREGNRFICMNRLPVQHVVMASKWLKRNPRLAFSETVQDCNERNAFNGINGGHDGVRLFPISSNITTADGHAGSFSAACAVHVWFGGGLTPECDGAVFSCDPTGNLVHADRLTPQGATFTATPLYPNRELLASRDDWFRPVYLTPGPDGALYVADMYRKVIEHPDYLGEEIRKHTDFVTGKNSGRIWRVRAEKPYVAAAPPARVALTDRQRFLSIIAQGDDKSPAATQVLAQAALRNAEDKWMRNAVLSGISGREKAFLAELIALLPSGGKVGAGLAEIFGQVGGSFVKATDLEVANGTPAAVRLALLSGYLSTSGRKPIGLSPSFQSLLDESPSVALDLKQDTEERSVAVRLMARLPWERTGDSLLKLALDETSPELAAVALKAVVAYPRTEVSAALLAGWSHYPPARRDAVLGALLGAPFHLPGVLDAVATKHLPASAFTGVRRRQVLAAKNPVIKAMAERLLIVSARPEALAEASNALALTSVPANGRLVFNSICATCHRLEREGYAVGPDLFDIRRQTKENILFHLVNPDAEIAPAFTAYLAEAKDGRILSGILVGDTPTSITLRGPLGVEASLLRSDLAKLEALPNSLMPTGLEAGLSQQQLADLLAYLKGEK